MWRLKPQFSDEIDLWNVQLMNLAWLMVSKKDFFCWRKGSKDS